MVTSIPHLDKPILMLMEAPGMVRGLSQVPSWRPVHVATEASCLKQISEEAFSAFIALSPMAQSGAAGRMITAFRERNPTALTVYHGWCYKLETTFARALRCNADVALVGGIAAQDLVFLLGTAILLKRRTAFTPSVEAYRLLLEQTCAGSPFWRMQDIPCPAGDVE